MQQRGNDTTPKKRIGHVLYVDAPTISLFTIQKDGEPKLRTTLPSSRFALWALPLMSFILN